MYRNDNGGSLASTDKGREISDTIAGTEESEGGLPKYLLLIKIWVDRRENSPKRYKKGGTNHELNHPEAAWRSTSSLSADER